MNGRRLALFPSFLLAASVPVMAQAPTLGASCSTAPQAARGIADPRAHLAQQNAIRQWMEFTRTHTLYELAVACGGLYGVNESYDTRVMPRNLDDILRGRNVTAVLGVVTAARPELTSDGRGIVTYYDIRVTETLKGSNASTRLLSVPQGKITFDDGAVAEITIHDFSIDVGRTYVVFTRPAVQGQDTDADVAGARGASVLLNGAQGLVDVSGLTVKTMGGRPVEPFKRLYDGTDSSRFLEELRAAVARLTLAVDYDLLVIDHNKWPAEVQ
jgi:hypothetical protein